MTAMFTPRLDAFRFYQDDAGEAASTPLENEDTNHSLDVSGGNTAIQVRLLIQETAGDDGDAMHDYTLEYSKNGGADTTVPTTDGGDGIVAVTAGLTNDAATTNRATNGITDGSGTFVAGEQSSDGVVDNFLLTSSNFTEHVWGVQFNVANLSDGDSFVFTVDMFNKATDAVNPTITITGLATLGDADIIATAKMAARATPIHLGRSNVAASASVNARSSNTHFAKAGINASASVLANGAAVAPPTQQAASISATSSMGSKRPITYSNVQTVGAFAGETSVTITAYGIPDGLSQVLVVCASAVEQAVGENADAHFASVTYNGTGLTKAVASQDHTGGPPFPDNEIWYLDNPAAIAASGDIVASTTATVNSIQATAFVLSNAEPGGPEATASDNTDAASPYPLSITIQSTGAFVVDSLNFHNNTRFTPASGQTEIEDTGGVNLGAAVGVEIVSATGSTEFSWTASQSEETAHTLAAWSQATIKQTIQQAASIVSTASLGARSTNTHFARTGVSATGKLAARATNIHLARAGINAAATVNARATNVHLARAAIKASASLGARFANIHLARAAVASTAKLAARATNIHLARAAVASSATMAAQATNTHFAKAGVTASATLFVPEFSATTPVGGETVTEAATVSSLATLSARATNVHLARAAIAAVSTLGARAERITRQSGAITATSTIGATATNIHLARAAVSATSTVSVPAFLRELLAKSQIVITANVSVSNTTLTLKRRAGIAAAGSMGAVAVGFVPVAGARRRDFPMLVNTGRFMQR